MYPLYKRGRVRAETKFEKGNVKSRRQAGQGQSCSEPPMAVEAVGRQAQATLIHHPAPPMLLSRVLVGCLVATV